MIFGTIHGRIQVDEDEILFFEHPITAEEIGMAADALQELIGEGDARVTASLDLKDGHFGTGFGAHVSVSLSVDQTEKGLEAGFGVALDLAHDFASEAFDTALQLRKQKDKAGSYTRPDK